MQEKGTGDLQVVVCPFPGGRSPRTSTVSIAWRGKACSQTARMERRNVRSPSWHASWKILRVSHRGLKIHCILISHSTRSQEMPMPCGFPRVTIVTAVPKPWLATRLPATHYPIGSASCLSKWGSSGCIQRLCRHLKAPWWREERGLRILLIITRQDCPSSGA